MQRPRAHKLQPHVKGDFRAQKGLQDFVATAPLNFVYVAHGERMRDVTPEEGRLYACVDASFIGQNVYLFCAAEGLATMVPGSGNTSDFRTSSSSPSRKRLDIPAANTDYRILDLSLSASPSFAEAEVLMI